MILYNSASRKREEFVPNNPELVSMYTCGPTVYHFAHIGNLRSYIMEDILEKYLRYAGYNVKRVMNITDVGHLTSDADEGEDKMLKGAKREHKSVMEIAKFYTDAFFSDCEKLNIKRPDVVEPATNCIDDYIRIITKLLDTGYAYIAGGNVYFDTSKLDRYYIFNDFNEVPISPEATFISIPQSLTAITSSTISMKRISPSAYGKVWRKIPTNGIKMTLFSGSPNPNLKIRL